MLRHTFIRQSKLRDVKGRIDYIQNPKRQEHLYATYDTTKPEYWQLLAAQNQMDFQRSGASGKCIEARELIIALPEGLQLYEPEKLSVFPKGGPFLAMQKIGKNNPKEKEIMESNELRKKWNTAVSDGLMRGMSAEDLKQAKKKWITEPVARSLKKYDRNPGIFIMIMKKAIYLLVEKVHDFRPSIMATIAQLKEETQKKEITKHSMKSRKRKRDIER